MIDYFVTANDSLANNIDSLSVDTLNQIIHKVSNPSFYENLADSPLVLKILLPIFLMIIGWILKLVFDKYIAIRPRLYLKLGNPLYRQRILGYDIGHELTWIYECALKNNSKYDAYDIELFEYKPCSEENKIISNRQELDRIFIPNNHIASNDSLSFEIKKTIKTPPDILLKLEKRGNETIVTPGIKIPNPQTALMPKELNTIRLVVKYKNEKGKVFYTRFMRLDKTETNKIKTMKPWLIHGLVK